MSLKEIFHFLLLEENLLTGGMPTAGQLKEIAEADVRVVINLAMPNSPRGLPGEADLVQSLGMQYVGIPVEWEHPTRQKLDEFMDAMDRHKSEKLFVHCQANYRVSGFIALYRVLRLGWKEEEAFQDMHRMWDAEESPVWKKFIGENLKTGPGKGSEA